MGVETIVYADSDHAGDYADRKSTSDVCTFMGCCLTWWFSKKQTALAISTTEAEYVSAGQALWMKQALVDYDINLDDIPVLCDNKSAIDLSKNPILHSRTKHIEIRHHFLRDNVQKGNISIEKVSSEDNIADILTKPLKRESFNLLRLEDLPPTTTNPPTPRPSFDSIEHLANDPPPIQAMEPPLPPISTMEPPLSPISTMEPSLSPLPPQLPTFPQNPPSNFRHSAI
ncbi:hypothetical protein Tco_0800520 [Tanacetum coccineum]|uniref:Copia protein n=1 Tax=Tanacetum coccineum TaxID=301880 RepID=A0ABQ4ZXG2_9ASTR